MRLKAALAAAALLMPLAAQADVVYSNQASGTGINVVTEKVDPADVIGNFNGQNNDTVLYNDLGLNFNSNTSGQDIKIGNTSTLQFQVFDPLNNVVGTTTQVFSLKGTGDVNALVTTNDGTFQYDLGVLSNSQDWATFTAINNEVILAVLLTDTGGTITDFEHDRIDVAAVSEVPVPATLWLFGSALVGLGMLQRKRIQKQSAVPA